MPRSDSPNGELMMRRATRKTMNSDDERIGVGGLAVQVEAEIVEDRPHLHALQAVGAAGEPARAVRRLVQQQAHAERDHDQGEMAEARDDEARSVADDPGHRRADQQPGDRLAPAGLRDEAGRIGPEPEERRMAERHDPGIAQNEIEREREQRRDGDLAREHEVVREQPERQQRGEPEHDLDRMPARLRLQIGVRRGQRVVTAITASRTGRPAATSAARP